MATSGSTNFSINRDDIIKRALRLIGVLPQGESPSTDQVTEASLALNGLVKAWQADGMPLWAIRTSSFTLTATSSYTVGIGQTVSISKPLKVLQAWNRNTTSNVDVPMRILTKDEYNRLGNKTSTGNPIQLYYDPGIDTGTIYLFPVPDTTSIANQTIYFTHQRTFEDFDSSTDTPDFPQEWYDAVVYGLACRLAPEYGVAPTDRKLLWQEMTIIKNEAMSFGTEEGSLFFGVDFREY